MIQSRELSLRNKHGIREDRFTPSGGWVNRFTPRAGMGNSIKLYGEVGEVVRTAADKSMVEICTKQFKYSHKEICNEDETGFLFQCFPIFSYLSPDEDSADACGSKAM